MQCLMLKPSMLRRLREIPAGRKLMASGIITTITESWSLAGNKLAVNGTISIPPVSCRRAGSRLAASGITLMLAA